MPQIRLLTLDNLLRLWGLVCCHSHGSWGRLCCRGVFRGNGDWVCRRLGGEILGYCYWIRCGLSPADHPLWLPQLALPCLHCQTDIMHTGGNHMVTALHEIAGRSC